MQKFFAHETFPKPNSYEAMSVGCLYNEGVYLCVFHISDLPFLSDSEFCDFSEHVADCQVAAW